MAARYVNPDNIAAQGQSFYTGLHPVQYQSGSGGGSNVMGAGSGGSAGVAADRSGADAGRAWNYPALDLKLGGDGKDKDGKGYEQGLRDGVTVNVSQVTGDNTNTNINEIRNEQEQVLTPHQRGAITRAERLAADETGTYGKKRPIYEVTGKAGIDPKRYRVVAKAGSPSGHPDDTRPEPGHDLDYETAPDLDESDPITSSSAAVSNESPLANEAINGMWAETIRNRSSSRAMSRARA